MKTTSQERAMHVRQANANQALEGLQPDAGDREIQARYIAGTATLTDLLDHAKRFVVESRNRMSKPS